MAHKLLDPIINLEPPSLGRRLDMLEEALRLLNERTSRMQRDIVELRECFILLDRPGRNKI